jgi:2-C-methyl-D-erythritol 4-phosphate cytidylyltransferase/2-C-methyl-D-erythritol 2,4-cyclodiphosphate synthase
MNQAHGLPPIHLVVLAGGQGVRARRGDSAPPKQFRQIGGRMLLMWSVSELLAPPQVASLTIAAPEPWHPLVRAELEKSALSLPWYLAPAGATRTASTWLAAMALAVGQTPGDDDLVAVHDAARPFVTRHLLLRLAAAAESHGAAVPGIPVADTIVRLEDAPPPTGEALPDPTDPRPAAGSKGDRVQARYLERAALRALQTPQLFRWPAFYEAHRWCHEEDLTFTDDGGLLMARGHTPVVVMGEAENWKITTDSDLERAESVLRAK